MGRDSDISFKSASILEGSDSPDPSSQRGAKKPLRREVHEARQRQPEDERGSFWKRGLVEEKHRYKRSQQMDRKVGGYGQEALGLRRTADKRAVPADQNLRIAVFFRGHPAWILAAIAPTLEAE